MVWLSFLSPATAAVRADGTTDEIAAARLVHAGARIFYEAQLETVENRGNAGRRVQSAVFRDLHISKDTLLELKFLKRPAALTFWHCQLPVDGLSIIASLSTVHDIMFADCNLDEDNVQRLTNMPKLSRLHLFNMVLQGRVVSALEHMQRLDTLSLGCCTLPAGALVTIARMHQLENLDLTDISTDDDLGAFRSNNTLRSLKVSYFHNRIVPSVLPLELTALDISHDEVNDRTVAEVAQLRPTLRLLDLSGTAVTDEGLAALGGLHNLRSLAVRDTPLTDKCCRYLAALESLRFLSINGTAITDQGASKLSPLKHMVSLNARHTAITDVGKRQLETAIPGLVVSISH
jgi:hypothetical protein